MKLTYYNESFGRNFGDLLNDHIFNHFLPEFFDDQDDIHFVGIGSILGLGFAKKPGKKIVFSSGFAYGQKPEIDDTYDVICVRGPLTAVTLGLDPSLAVADGAYLLYGMPRPPKKKLYESSLMLHWSNLEKYDWRPICNELNINFIDPRDNINSILDQIQQSKIVLAEAMHAAIAADALRVPWVPMTCYQGVNSFKWNDFMSSVGMNYSPHHIGSLYTNNEYMSKIIRKKTKGLINTKNPIWSKFLDAYLLYQNSSKISKTKARLLKLKNMPGQLSKLTVCEARYTELRQRLDTVIQRYGKTKSQSH